jgi:hypothetical protein
VKKHIKKEKRVISKCKRQIAAKKTRKHRGKSQRNIITVHGRKRYVVRDSKGRFRDNQNIRLSKQRELRKTHVKGADRESKKSRKSSY